MEKIRLIAERPCGYQETIANFWTVEEAIAEMELQVQSLLAVLSQAGRGCVVFGKHYDDYRRIENPETSAVLACFRLLYEEMS